VEPELPLALAQDEAARAEPALEVGPVGRVAKVAPERPTQFGRGIAGAAAGGGHPFGQRRADEVSGRHLLDPRGADRRGEERGGNADGDGEVAGHVLQPASDRVKAR
jgi:hypothetical protein